MTDISIQEFKDIWKGLFPREAMPEDDQWLLWKLRHSESTIKEALSDLASKYHRLNERMDQDHMLRFVSAVMNRITREQTITNPIQKIANRLSDEQVKRVANAAGLADSVLEDSRSNGGNPPPTVDAFLSGLNAALKWFTDGEADQERAHQMLSLVQKLIYDYPAFPEAYLLACDEKSPIQATAKELIRNGKVTTATPLSALGAIAESGYQIHTKGGHGAQ